MERSFDTLVIISCWGNVKWRIYSVCSGIDCMHEAINMLDTAVVARFGFHLNVKYNLHALWLEPTISQRLSSFSLLSFDNLKFRCVEKWVTSQPSTKHWTRFFLQPSTVWLPSLHLSDSEVEKNKACQRALAEHYPETCLMGDVLHVLAHEREKTKACLKKRKLAKAFDCVVHENRCPGFTL